MVQHSLFCETYIFVYAKFKNCTSIGISKLNHQKFEAKYNENGFAIITNRIRMC